MTIRSFLLAALRGFKYRDADYFRLLVRVALSRPKSPGRVKLRCGTIDYLDAAALFGQYEEIFAQRGYDFVSASKSPVVVDCGGNIGLSVIRITRLFPRAQIHVYEADPRIAKLLKENLRRNGISAHVMAVAVTDATGEVWFNADGNDGGTILEGTDSVRVASVRLAEVLPPRVDLLKLDIEGAEFSVLRDLCSSGAIARVMRIAGEFHTGADSLVGIGYVLSLMEKAGFQIAFPFARQAPELHGEVRPTPFVRIHDGKCLLHFYAWRAQAI